MEQIGLQQAGLRLRHISIEQFIIAISSMPTQNIHPAKNKAERIQDSPHYDEPVHGRIGECAYHEGRQGKPRALHSIPEADGIWPRIPFQNEVVV